jgi:hypothetical protein
MMLVRLHKALVLSVAGFFLLFKIDRVPGMHGDEGWSILLARAIAGGQRPFINMNRYTGTLFQFLSVPAFEHFGYSLETLRWISAVFNLGALFFFMSAMDALSSCDGGEADGREARAFGPGIRFGWLLATLPLFVIMSRFSAEVTALSPFLDAAALYLLASTIWGPRMSGFLAGLLMAVATYNHILNLTFVGALALAVAGTWGRSAWRDRRVPAALIAFFLLYLPALAVALRQPELMAGVTSGRLHSILEFSFLRDFSHLPFVFLDMWSGKSLYLQTAGEALLPVLPYGLVIALLLFGLATFPGLKRGAIAVSDSRTRFLALLVVADFILTGVASPLLIERYFEISFILFAGLLVWLTRKSHQFALFGILLLSFANACYLGSNYFYAFSRTGGKLAAFNMGRRGMEASNNFIDKRPLIAQLKKNKISTVATDFITRNALLASQIDSPGFEVVSVNDFSHPVFSRQSQGKAAIVTFNGLNPMDIMVMNPPRHRAIRERSGKTFRLSSSFDPRFLVFVEN